MDMRIPIQMSEPSSTSSEPSSTSSELTSTSSTEPAQPQPQASQEASAIPFTKDDTDLRVYYRGLDPETVKDDVEVMKVASIKELYQLIATNCRHYVSIIENYKTENLQSLFNMSIRRIQEHLVIKFRFTDKDRWIEVGFLDDDNTDAHTMEELKGMIKYQLKHHSENSKEDRKHLLAELDQQDQKDLPDQHSTPSKRHRKTSLLTENEFDPATNPELAITPEKRKSAGYNPMPDNLKDVYDQLRKPATKPLNLSQYDSHHQLNPPKPTCPDNAVNTVNAVNAVNGAGRATSQPAPQSSVTWSQAEHLLRSRQERTLRFREEFKQLISLLRRTSITQHYQIYSMIHQLINKQDTATVAELLISLGMNNL
jgi:hypothetical protein